MKPFDSLTPHVQHMLRLAAEGLSNKEIALVFGLSEATIKVHFRRAFKEIGIRSRTELVPLLSIKAAAANVTLSESDETVARAVAVGKRNQQIAEETGIDVALVKAALRRICTRTGTRNRTELAAWWHGRESGLISNAPAVAVSADARRLTAQIEVYRQAAERLLATADEMAGQLAALTHRQTSDEGRDAA